MNCRGNVSCKLKLCLLSETLVGPWMWIENELVSRRSAQACGCGVPEYFSSTASNAIAVAISPTPADQDKRTPRLGILSYDQMEIVEGTKNRRRQTKSFKGCNACKVGKRKCSEERPRCWQCSIRKIECKVTNNLSLSLMSSTTWIQY